MGLLCKFIGNIFIKITSVNQIYFNFTRFTEFGLYYKEQNIKVEVKAHNAEGKFDSVKIFIDDNEYDSGKKPD